MNRADYEALLQDCFDRRVDPLDDARVQAHLELHPQAIEALARQRALLLAVARRAEAKQPMRRRWPWLVPAAASLAAASLAAASLLAWPEPVPPPPRGRILQASLTEQRAGVGAAFHCRLHQQLLHTDTTRLEIVEHWSIRR